METSRRSSILKPPKIREPLADVNLPCNRNEVTLLTPRPDVCRRSTKVGFASIKIKEFGCEDKSIVVSVAPIFEKRICTPSDSSLNCRSSSSDSANVTDDEICKCTHMYSRNDVRVSSMINGNEENEENTRPNSSNLKKEIPQYSFERLLNFPDDQLLLSSSQDFGSDIVVQNEANRLSSDSSVLLKRKVMSQDDRIPSLMSPRINKSSLTSSSPSSLLEERDVSPNVKRIKQDDGNPISNRFSIKGNEVIRNNNDNGNNCNRRRTIFSLSDMSMTQIIQPNEEYAEQSYITNKSLLNMDSISNNSSSSSSLSDMEQTSSIDQTATSDQYCAETEYCTDSSRMQMTLGFDGTVNNDDTSGMQLTEMLDNSNIFTTRYFASTSCSVETTKSMYEDMEVSYGETEHVYDRRMTDSPKSGQETSDMVLTKLYDRNEEVRCFQFNANETQLENPIEDRIEISGKIDGSDMLLTEVINENVFNATAKSLLSDNDTTVTSIREPTTSNMSLASCLRSMNSDASGGCGTPENIRQNVDIKENLLMSTSAMSLESDKVNFIDMKENVRYISNSVSSNCSGSSLTAIDGDNLSRMMDDIQYISNSISSNSSDGITAAAATDKDNIFDIKQNVQCISSGDVELNAANIITVNEDDNTRENRPNGNSVLLSNSSNIIIEDDSVIEQVSVLIEESAVMDTTTDILRTENDDAYNTTGVLLSVDEKRQLATTVNMRDDNNSITFAQSSMIDKNTNPLSLSRNAITQAELVRNAEDVNTIVNSDEANQFHGNTDSLSCRNFCKVTFPKLVGSYYSTKKKKNNNKQKLAMTKNQEFPVQFIFESNNLSPLSEIMNKSTLIGGLVESVRSNLEKEWLNGKQEWIIKEMKCGSWVFAFMKNDLEVEILYEVDAVKLGTVNKINFQVLADELNFRSVLLNTLVRRKYTHDKKTTVLNSRLDEVPLLLNRISTDVRFVKEVLKSFIWLSCKHSIKFTKEGFIFEVISMPKILLVEIHVKLHDFDCIHPYNVDVKTIIGQILYPYKITTLCVGLNGPDFASKFVEAVNTYVQNTDQL